MVDPDNRSVPIPRRRRFSRGRRPAVRTLTSAVFVAVVVQLTAMDVDETPSALVERAVRAQKLVEQLRAGLSIDSTVRIAVVVYHPLVFSVQRDPSDLDRFLLSIEAGFLHLLNDDELRAALAHELGHVWIFTHHPFLQTERLANDIAMREVDRRNFEAVYRKLWMYEGSPGVPIANLLGDEPEPDVVE